MEMNKFELLDFSDEILLKMFTNFNDIDLLNATQICRRFEAIGKDTFAKKYNGDSDEKWYEINLYSDDSKEDQRFYRRFVEIFGNEMIALKLNAEYQSNRHKMLKLINQHCRSTKYLIVESYEDKFNLTQLIQSMHNLSYLFLKRVYCTNFYWADIRFPRLKQFIAEEFHCLNFEFLTQFVYINPQLEYLRLMNCRKFPLKVIQALRGKLKRLKSLEYWTEDKEFSNRCRDINFEQLESLKITVNASSFWTILSAIARGSKMIRSLYVTWSGEHSDDTIQQLYEIFRMFDKLTFLQINNFIFPINVIRTLVYYLPKIESLKLEYVRLDQLSSNDVLLLFRKCKLLKELYLSSNNQTTKIEKFDSNFHRKFVEIIKNRDCKVKFEIVQPEIKLIVTKEKIMKNNEVIFWIELDPSNNGSNVRFVDLTDECLEKICTYLDETSIRAFYETCIRTRNTLQQRLREQIFAISDASTAKETLIRFGEHITKLAIDLSTNNRDSLAAVWTLVNKKCCQNLIELHLNNIRVDAWDLLNPVFPNLTTLKITQIVCSNVHILPPMECPKLSQLEFEVGEITLPVNVSQFGINFNQLTTIKLLYFSDSIEKILHTLDDTVCDQILEFSVDITRTTQGTRVTKRLMNITPRFRNLITLSLMIFQIEYACTKYLFESCIKLEKLSLYYNWSKDSNWRQMIQHIKKNCKRLEVLQLMRYNNDFDYYVLREIVDTFSGIKLNTIVYDYNLKTYKVEAFRKITKADFIKPF